MATEAEIHEKMIGLIESLSERIDKLESTGSKEKETRLESERPSAFSKEYDLNHDDIKAWANKKVIV